jgi:5-bromo-4-chloroindolyl phosphate hydrolysis protein
MAKTKRYNPPISQANVIKRGTLLYFFLFPLFLAVVIALFQMKMIAFMLNCIAFILLFGVVYLSKLGFIQEIQYEQAIFAKAPKTKYKSLAAILLGITTFYTAAIAGGEPLGYSLIWGIISVVGYWLYYGLDPNKDKLEDFGDISSDMVLETFDEAQKKLAKIAADNKNIKDKELHNKIEIALQRANVILDTIAADPKDIRAARKFLIVYIDGVAKVTSSYRAIDEDEIDALTREKLLSVMQDVEVRFEKEMQRLKENNKFDLDVQIDVLKQQIKN